MNYNIEQMADKVMERLYSMSKSETVIGDAFKLGSYEVVPIVKVSMGFGSGQGGGEDVKRGSGGGGGVAGGVSIEPIAFLVSSEDKIELIQVNKSKGLTSLFESMPGLVEKMAAFKKSDKDKEKKNEIDE